MFSLNSTNSVTLNSVTKKLKIKRKIAGLELRTSCVRDRADPYNEPNSCLSVFSDSLNSLNSLNSMKVLLHLEKTPIYSHPISPSSPVTLGSFRAFVSSLGVTSFRLQCKKSSLISLIGKLQDDRKKFLKCVY